MWRPRKDSNLRTRFRKPMLYPLSYGGGLPREFRFRVGVSAKAKLPH